MKKKPNKTDLKNAHIISPEEAKEIQAIPFDENDDLREKACEGKNVGDLCRWTSSSGVENAGLCKMTILGYWGTLRCEGNSGSGSGSGETPGPKVLACENKSEGDPCSWITDSGSISYGRCKKDTNQWTSGALYCSNVTGSLSEENDIKDSKTDDLL